MDVAIYLRKSRDEADKEDVLAKHRDTLTAIAKEKGWKYTLYEEIASGERIAYRPVMQELLETVEKGMYEAVLVRDIDRLGRGNNKDWGVIYEAFCSDDHNTLIVTPQRTYDLTIDTDEMMVDFQSLFAKMEYKQIKKRMLRGKIAGAKRGQWVCGKPPFPYVRKDGEIIVDQEKAQTYRMIMDMALAGNSLEQIMVYLNTNHVKTPSGIIPHGSSGWNYQQVHRMLADETHLGFLIYGKTKGDPRRGNFVKLPRDQWIIVKGDHEPLKTQEEHEKVLALIASRRTTPVAARAGKYVFSGLLYCKKCDYAMRVTTSKGKYKCVICGHRFSDGSRCKQRGIAISSEFMNNIYAKLFNIDENRLLEMRNSHRENEIIKTKIDDKKKELTKIEKALSRLYDLYEEGDIGKEEFRSRKELRARQKGALLNEIEKLQSNIVLVESEEVILNRIKQIKETLWQCTDTKLQNEMLRSVIKKIVYDREGDEQPTIEIYYK